jgi:hyperosmotically inducible protein
LMWLPCADARADRGAPDGWLTAKVKLGLWTARDLDGLDTNVDTYGGVVTLAGKAASQDDKRRAGEIAREVDGVKEVRNLLVVVRPEERKRTERSDEQLEKRVKTVLERDAALEDSKIQVKSVNGGVVLLEGEASSLRDHLRAVEDARAVQGVTRVASEVESPDREADRDVWSDEDESDRDRDRKGPSDGRITAAVKLRLLGSRDIPGLSINVDTRDGVVTLFGAVPRREVAQLAEREAKKATGVRRVENELQVVPEDRAKRVSRRDDELQDQVEERIKDADIDDVDVEVSNGVVRLTGTAPSGPERLQALTLARSTEGVRSVIDDMKTERKERKDRKESRAPGAGSRG